MLLDALSFLKIDLHSPISNDKAMESWTAHCKTTYWSVETNGMPEPAMWAAIEKYYWSVYPEVDLKSLLTLGPNNCANLQRHL